MAQPVDITGQKFGRLTAVRPMGPTGPGRRLWECLCDCGKTSTVVLANLTNGNTRSCGCFKTARLAERSRTHGHTVGHRLTAEYRAYHNMKSRCLKPNASAYGYYGARGIRICDRWLKGRDGLSGFECFLADVGPKPTPQHTLSRVNNDGDYEPNNVVWSTPAIQNRNKRNTIVIEYNGRQMVLHDALRAAGIAAKTFYYYRRTRRLKPQSAFDFCRGIKHGRSTPCIGARARRDGTQQITPM